MKAYIHSTSAISAHQTFDKSSYLAELEVSDHTFLKAYEPVYRDIINPKLLRRMSRIIKMAVACTNQILTETKVISPEAIVVGTGLGCIQDTHKFLKDIITGEEGILSPTAFIQSTHNTIAGQIALLLQCPNYNFTYSNRGHSFENALIDGCMQLGDGKNNILVGAADEMTPDVLSILSQMTCVNNSSHVGEGAAFFMLSNQSKQNTPYLQDIHTSSNIGDSELGNNVQLFCEKNGINYTDIDLLMLGDSEADDDQHYKKVKSVLKNTATLSYKKICGEYYTSSGFAMHLAAMLLKYPGILNESTILPKFKESIRTILIYNHHNAVNHSLMLLSI